MILFRNLMAICFFLTVSFPVWAQDGKQCYRKEDCECAFGADGLRDGRWYAEAAPGGFDVVGMGKTVMNAASNHVDIVDHCDGTMDMFWQDEEAGRIEWKLERVSAGDSLMPSPYEKVEQNLLDEFYAVDANLADLAKDEMIYLGTAVYSYGGGEIMYGTMVLVYSGLPGDAAERGYAAMTMKFDYRGHIIWATTGRVDFYFSDVPDEIYERRREICRCDEVEKSLLSDTIGARLQKQLKTSMEGRAKRRVGYDHINVIGSKSDEFPKVMNERFKPDENWVRPSAGEDGNWPCLTQDQLDETQKVSDQVTFGKQLLKEYDQTVHEIEQIDRRVAGLPTEAYVHPKPGDTTDARSRGAGYVESSTCMEMVIDADGKKIPADDPDFKKLFKRDGCSQTDARYQSIRVHEAAHRKSCKKREAETFQLGVDLQKAADKNSGFKIPGLTAKQAEQAFNEGVASCLDYEAYVANSMLAAKEELMAYTAGRQVLIDWTEKYCKR